MTAFNWQQQEPERAGIYTLEGYEVTPAVIVFECAFRIETERVK